jgi:arginine-tRNA-protein transferase
MSCQAVISFPAYRSEGHCGYCESATGSKIFGFSAFKMPIELYGELLDKGFRRSGTFLYRPDLANSCCPQYTIRLHADEFKPSKEAKKVIKNFNKHISNNSNVNTENNGNAIEERKKKKVKGSDNKLFDFDEAIKLSEKNDRFKIMLLDPKITEEKFQLYKKYQQSIHKDDPESVTRNSLKRFLCSNPFNQKSRISYERLKIEGGHFHQGYYLDGKLIALAVLDSLPGKCLSSVYFMYDPDYTHLNLGKFSALKEIALTRELGHKYYYLGYYIYTCTKMRYKGNYKPSDLLDPTSTSKPVWYPLEKFQNAFEKSTLENKYATILNWKCSTDDEKSGSQYFSRHVPGVLSYKEAEKVANNLYGYYLLQPDDNGTVSISEDDEDYNEEDDEYADEFDDEYRPRLRKIHFGPFSHIPGNKVFKDMFLELIATLGPDLAPSFGVVY